MAPKDFDLPDPQPHSVLSESEYQARRFSLYKSLLYASVLYALLHKVLIPLMLSTTKVLVYDYTRVDFWILPALSLALYLFYKKNFDRLASVLAGCLVGYGVWEAVAILQGEHKGWLSWSHALSSIPQAAMAIILLSSQKKSRSLKAAWFGALSVMMMLAALKLFSPSVPTISETTLTTIELPLKNPDLCGANEFRVHLAELKPQTTLNLSDCGLSPLALLHPEHLPLLLKRRHAIAMNIHVVFYTIEGKRSRQSNRLLKATEQQVELHNLRFASGESAAVLYSDTQPQIGKILIVNPTLKPPAQSVGVTSQRTVVWSVTP